MSVLPVAQAGQAVEPGAVANDAGGLPTSAAPHARVELGLGLVGDECTDTRVVPQKAVGRVLDGPADAAGGELTAAGGHEVGEHVRAVDAGFVPPGQGGEPFDVVVVAKWGWRPRAANLAGPTEGATWRCPVDPGQVGTPQEVLEQTLSHSVAEVQLKDLNAVGFDHVIDRECEEAKVAAGLAEAGDAAEDFDDDGRGRRAGRRMWRRVGREGGRWSRWRAGGDRRRRRRGGRLSGGFAAGALLGAVILAAAVHANVEAAVAFGWGAAGGEGAALVEVEAVAAAVPFGVGGFEAS